MLTCWQRRINEEPLLLTLRPTVRLKVTRDKSKYLITQSTFKQFCSKLGMEPGLLISWPLPDRGGLHSDLLPKTVNNLGSQTKWYTVSHGYKNLEHMLLETSVLRVSRRYELKRVQISNVSGNSNIKSIWITTDLEAERWTD